MTDLSKFKGDYNWKQIAERAAEFEVLEMRARRAAEETCSDLRLRISELVATNNKFLAEIEHCHDEYVTEKCDACHGSGEMYEDQDTMTNSPGLTPGKITVQVQCSQCYGTGKEWS